MTRPSPALSLYLAFLGDALVIVATGVLTLSGCDPSPAPRTAGDYFADIGHAGCARVADCGTSDPEVCARRFLDDACTAPNLAACDAVVDVDPEAFAACLDRLEARTCDDYSTGLLPVECTSIDALFKAGR